MGAKIVAVYAKIVTVNIFALNVFATTKIKPTLYILKRLTLVSRLFLCIAGFIIAAPVRTPFDCHSDPLL